MTMLSSLIAHVNRMIQADLADLAQDRRCFPALFTSVLTAISERADQSARVVGGAGVTSGGTGAVDGRMTAWVKVGVVGDVVFRLGSRFPWICRPGQRNF